MYDIYENFRKYEEQKTRIEILTGCTLDKLEKLLMEGWALRPPDPQPSLKEFNKQLRKDKIKDLIKSIFRRRMRSNGKRNETM